MNSYINTAENFVAIKDMSNVIDFTSINNEFDTLSFKPNKDNSISENMNFFDKDIFKEHKDILVQECKNYLNQLCLYYVVYQNQHEFHDFGRIL